MAGEAKEFWQRFLPNQWENRRHGPNIGPMDYEQFLFGFTAEFNGGTHYSDLNLEVPAHMPVEAMASDPITLSFLQFLVRMHQPRTLFEIGTYIGISTIKLARAMPRDSEIYTWEKGEEFSRIARANILRNQVDRVDIGIKQGDALEGLQRLADHKMAIADMIFLDADKENYPRYTIPINTLLKPGGILIVDDVFFHGDALNQYPQTEKGQGCRWFLERIHAMRWPKVILPLANGLLLAKKT